MQLIKREVTMTLSPQDSMHKMVHEYPHGGLTALAARLEMPEQTLRNKATLDRIDGEPRNSEFKLSELARINRLCNSLLLAQSFAADVGAVVVRLPDAPDCGDAALLDIVLASTKEFGDLGATLSRALEDGEICERDFRDVDREAKEAVVSILELVDRVRGMVVDRPRMRAVAKAVR
jgi:hypothetical protein